MNDAQPEAEALAIKDGIIIKIGTNTEIEALKNDDTKVIDAKNQFVMPGFIDGHAHFSSLGESLMNLNLMQTKNWSEIIGLVKDEINKTEKNVWIQGRGWHQEKWNEAIENEVEGYPSHETLSAISPDNPVVLSHASGHAVFANAKAMEIAGITDETPNPEGGRIVRNKDGKAIGVFEEMAEMLITDALKKYRERMTADEKYAEWLKKVDLATAESLSHGITSFQDAGSFFEEISWYEQLAKDKKLDVRLWVMISSEEVINDETLKDFPKIGVGNDFFTCRAIKGYADGALGSHGAWLLKSYTDKPNHFGQNVTPLADLKSNAEFAAKYDLQMCIHAIGDRANREILDIYENVFNQNKTKKDWRWRIEHAQHLNTADIPRFAKLGVIPSMQSVHCTSDAPFVPKRLGTLRAAQEAYVWRELIDAGSTIVNGTDAPVESVNPLPNLYAAMTRKLQTGESFYPQHAMTRLEALKSYTINNAFGGFEETKKGSLEVGKYADIVILNQNLLTCDFEKIQDTKVLFTIVNGEIKFESN
jgi:predicted amidohydrolase YtcJ